MTSITWKKVCEAAICLLVACSCLFSAAAVRAEVLLVYTVNYPLQYFAQRIGEGAVHAVFPGPVDADPAFWFPDAGTLAAYQSADLIMVNGAGYARWVDKVSLPRRKLVDTSAAFRSRYIAVDDVVTHQHGPAGEHAHTGTAFTTWMDLDQAAMQARAIKDALLRQLPDNGPVFEENFSVLERELRDLDEAMQTVVSADPARPLLASHPVYQYFSRRYGLNLVSLAWEPDRMPGVDQWRALEALLEEHPAKWMLWEADPEPEISKRLRGLGLNSVVVSPQSGVPQDGDFMTVMRRNVEGLREVFH